MPDFTIASAVCLMRSSLTSHANLFQLFHPIGGVGANAESCATTWEAEVNRTTPRKNKMIVLTWYGSSRHDRARSPKGVINDIQITNNRENECVMNSHSISQSALNHRNNRTANNCHN